MEAIKTEGGLVFEVRMGANPGSVNLALVDPSSKEQREMVVAIAEPEVRELARQLLQIADHHD